MMLEASIWAGGLTISSRSEMSCGHRQPPRPLDPNDYGETHCPYQSTGSPCYDNAELTNLIAGSFIVPPYPAQSRGADGEELVE